MPEHREQLVKNLINNALKRDHAENKKGYLDPDYKHKNVINPRYQELCLTLALARKYRIGIPDNVKDVELESTITRAIDGWFRLQKRNGSVSSDPSNKSDLLATTYGMFAVARTLRELGENISGRLHQKAGSQLKKAARYVMVKPALPGPEMYAIRYAAIKAIADYTGHSSMITAAEKFRRKTYKAINKLLDENLDCTYQDAGALAFALAYLVISIHQPTSEEEELFGKIIKRCKLSLMPCGIYGGGSEASIACLPISTGFDILADEIDEAQIISDTLEKSWNIGLYDSLLDENISWLTPLSYLVMYTLVTQKNRNLHQPKPLIHSDCKGSNGGGILERGDWLIRLGNGGTIGWLYHKPTESTRVFGSPEGLALREGPWHFMNNHLYHPALVEFYPVNNWDERYDVEAELPPVTIPGAVHKPQHYGFPSLKHNKNFTGDRLIPPPQKSLTRSGNTMKYRREIEIKEGALTIETYMAGRIKHRVPIIWLGGHYGKIEFDNIDLDPTKGFMDAHVKSITISGNDQPTWIARFDKPVGALYEPIHGLVNLHPLRYLSAAAASIDIIAEDRLHIAWRVKE